MLISERLDGNTVEISLHGTFDASTKMDLLATVEQDYLLGFHEFTFNLRNLRAMDQTGIGRFYLVLLYLRRQGCTQRIEHVSPSVRQLLEARDIPSLAQISTPDNTLAPSA